MYGLYVQTHGEGSSLMSPDLAIRGVWRICLFPSQGFVLNDDTDLRFCVCCNLDRPLLASPEPESETAFRTSLSHTFTYVVHLFAIARGDRWVLRWFLDISQTKVSLSYKSVWFSAPNSPSIPLSLPCKFFSMLTRCVSWSKVACTLAIEGTGWAKVVKTHDMSHTSN